MAQPKSLLTVDEQQDPDDGPAVGGKNDRSTPNKKIPSLPPDASLSLEHAKERLTQMIMTAPRDCTEQQSVTLIVETNTLIARQPSDQHLTLLRHVQEIRKQRAIATRAIEDELIAEKLEAMSKMRRNNRKQLLYNLRQRVGKRAAARAKARRSFRQKT